MLSALRRLCQRRLLHKQCSEMRFTADTNDGFGSRYGRYNSSKRQYLAYLFILSVYRSMAREGCGCKVGQCVRSILQFGQYRLERGQR